MTISHATFEAFPLGLFKHITLPWFSGISCLLIFLFTYRPRKVLTLLGYVLTPLLLICLAIIVTQGFWTMPTPPVSSHSPWETFAHGFLSGYNTMDLLAAFFFSSVVLLFLQKKEVVERKSMFVTAIRGSLIAAVLLSLVYVAFSFLAAGYSELLKGVAPDRLLGTLAYHLLGSQAGLFASITVGFACFTTEIALTAVFAEFLHRTLLKEKISYPQAIWITLILSFLMSTLQFNGISTFLVPLLKLCYPALIVLTVVNILHKLYGFKPVKRLFYGTIGATLALQLV